MNFVLPAYGENALSDVLPSIKARLTNAQPVLNIPAAKKYVIVMVDGLGHNLLEEYAEYAEQLTAMPRMRLTCGIPSTTATSLTSLGSGHAPGCHGVMGYTFYEPSVNNIVYALTWENGPNDVEGFRQQRTVFRELRDQGITSAAVTLGRFAGSAVTQLGFDGTELHPRPDEEAEVEATVRLVQNALFEHDVVYCYERLLDWTAHGHGLGSWQWLEQLERIDELVEGIVSLSSDDVCVLVTGDHGMINVPLEHRITIEHQPELGGFKHVGGEGRFRQIYVDSPKSAAKQWSTFLGERAMVLLKEEAIDAGWFGPEVTAKSASHLGDILVAMRSDWALMSTRFEKEFGLVGMHGSLTPEEMYIPLLIAGGSAEVRRG